MRHRSTGSDANASASATPKHWGRVVAGYGVAAGCFYWIFHDLNLAQLLESLARVNWWWVPLAIVLDLCTYVSVAWEWQFLLRPLGPLSFWRLNQAVFAGRFANDVLPVHMGYLIRIYLVSRWLGAPISAVIPSLLVERLFDGFWLALGIGITALFIPLPLELVRAAEILGALIVSGTGLMALLLFLRARRNEAVRPRDSKQGIRARLCQKISVFTGRLLDGLRGIGHSRWLGPAVALSVAKLLVQALTFLTLLWAYGFHMPFWVEFAVFAIACVGISLPSTPASAGVFQLFCVAGLTLFGVPKPTATGFALLAFVLITAPLATAGFFAVTSTGLSWRQLRQEAARLRSA